MTPRSLVDPRYKWSAHLRSLIEILLEKGGNLRVVEEAKRRIAHLEQTQADRTLIRTLANE